MNVQRLGLVLASILTISGCGYLGINQPDWPWKDSAALCKGADCSKQDALNAFNQAIKYCTEVQTFYSDSSTHLGLSQFAIGSVGTLSGAVVSPFAKGTSAKAWSGLSGSANAIQASLQQAFATTLAANRSNAIAQAMLDGQATFLNNADKDAMTRVTLAMDLASGCRIAQGTADIKSAQALTKEAVPASRDAIKVQPPQTSGNAPSQPEAASEPASAAST